MSPSSCGRGGQDRWLELTYGDDAVITQIDDRNPRGPGLAAAMQTSSAAAPDIVAVMLVALDAHPGHRVLEIGTGTGYNAALLALSETGYGDVRAVTGDGPLAHIQRTQWGY